MSAEELKLPLATVSMSLLSALQLLNVPHGDLASHNIFNSMQTMWSNLTVTVTLRQNNRNVFTKKQGATFRYCSVLRRVIRSTQQKHYCNDRNAGNDEVTGSGQCLQEDKTQCPSWHWDCAALSNISLDFKVHIV